MIPSIDKNSDCLDVVKFVLTVASCITVLVCGILGLTGGLDMPVWSGALATAGGSAGILLLIGGLVKGCCRKTDNS